jgi:hypothetical protein
LYVQNSQKEKDAEVLGGFYYRWQMCDVWCVSYDYEIFGISF